MELLKTIRDKLISTAAVTTLVSASDIRVRDMPLSRTNKQIILSETLGDSHSTLEAESGTFTIIIYVKDTVIEAYSILKQIIAVVLDTLDKKNETLADSNAYIREFRKTDGEPVHNDSEEFWMCPIVFDTVVGL